MSKQENMNETEEQTTEQLSENAQKNIFSKVITRIKNIKEDLLTNAENAIDKHQAIKALNKQFEQEATKFLIYTDEIKNGNYEKIKYIYAIKFPQEGYLLIRKSQSISIKTILTADKAQSFIVTDFDDKKIVNYPLLNQVPHPLECYKAFYQFHEITPTIVQQIQNQSVTINGNNSGNITLIAKQQDDLNAIESAINSYKPKFLGKGKKDEAIELFGNFKNCIINKQKDQTLFNKFLKVLEVVAPSVVSIATSLITSII